MTLANMVTVVGRFLTNDKRHPITTGELHLIPSVLQPQVYGLSPIPGSLDGDGDFQFTVLADTVPVTYEYHEYLNERQRTLSLTVPANATGELFIGDLPGWVVPSHVYLANVTTMDPATDPALKAASVSVLTGLSLNAAAGAANAAVIQAALDTAAAAGGGTVTIPIGTWVTAPLKLRTRVRLVGLGWGSQLKLASGSNDHLLSLKDVNTEQTTIADIWLDANGAGQSAGNWDAVNLTNTGYTNAAIFPSLGDPNHLMSRVSIVNAKRNGVYLVGSYSQSQFDKVLVSDCDGNSFALWGPDCHLINCVSRRSGLDGFGIYGNSERLLNCKAFLSGRLDNTRGSGFYVQGVNEIDLTHCEAQDNRQHGFSLNTTTTTSLVACRADRNGLGPEPVTTGGLGDGLFVYAVTDSRIDMICTDRNADGRKQRWSYNSGGNNARNIVTLVCGTNADNSIAGNGSFGATSAGFVRWGGANVATAFA